jgi:hypothetical protein
MKRLAPAATVGVQGLNAGPGATIEALSSDSEDPPMDPAQRGRESARSPRIASRSTNVRSLK